MQQMKKEGVRPDIHTYTSFINASCKAGDMQRAEQIIEEMEALGLGSEAKCDNLHYVDKGLGTCFSPREGLEMLQRDEVGWAEAGQSCTPLLDDIPAVKGNCC